MKGIIPWFAQNGVAANVLLVLIVVAGVMTIPGIKKEVFPEFSADIVRVTVEYRGAAPEEVEEGVCIKIEEEIYALDGIKRITSTAAEGSGTVVVEAIAGYDSRRLLDDIKTRVDSIDTFPEETEKPVIQEVTNRFQVINVTVAGDTGELTLKGLGERVRDEISNLPGISQVELRNAPPYEISIEVSEDSLRRYGITFDTVAEAVRRSSFDLPGGSVKTGAGEILLRTKGQAYRGAEFETLPLLTRADGSKLLLSDVARVRDGFAETDQRARFNGKPSVTVQVFRTGEESALDIADAVYAYVDSARRSMPEGIEITAWQDSARVLRSRMDLLLRNAFSGLLLVFVVLLLFLRFRLAFWVTIGIPISFLGALALMPLWGGSVNMISLFAFILVLGIVVDDAIVVGENIFAKQEEGKDGLTAAIQGTREVGIPVIFGVLTTVAAFAPMAFLPGYMGKIWRVIPLVVIPTLLLSLVESQLVLPSHLSHFKQRVRARFGIVSRIATAFYNLMPWALGWFLRRVYGPLLNFGLRWRYLTAATAVATLLISAGMIGGGYVKFVYFPVVESEYVVASLTMPLETPAAVTESAVKQIERAAAKLREEIEAQSGEKPVANVLASVGEQPLSADQQRRAGNQSAGGAGTHLGEVAIELTPSEQRQVSASEITSRWRELAGAIPGAVELSFSSDMLSSGDDIDVQLAGRDIEQLRGLADEIKGRLAEYPGVIDISDTFRGGKPEIKLSITSRAEALGLSLQDLARQVRQGFYGEEAQRIQRGRDDVRVMVRYPAEDRRSLGDLEQMRIRTPDGGEVPFRTVANARPGRGFSSITRVDRQRTIRVTADVDEAVSNSNEVLADLEENVLKPMMAVNPGVQYSFEGQQREQMESLSGLRSGFIIALFAIYAMLAIPFKSYLQPLIVMSAVPFGFVGAIWGHVILGLPFSIMSLLGIVALAGVVVNDSLVLVSHVNEARRAGNALFTAVHQAGLARFRPILLTSLTTAAGITPLMLERSVQAQFLIPMAVSLAFGVLFSTFISLALVPAGYLILEDIGAAFRWLFGVKRETALEQELAEAAGDDPVMPRRTGSRTMGGSPLYSPQSPNRPAESSQPAAD